MLSELVNFLECTLLHLMANNDKVMKLGSPRFVFSSSKSCLYIDKFALLGLPAVEVFQALGFSSWRFSTS